MSRTNLLSAAIATGAVSTVRPFDNGNRTYQATLTGTSGALSATVLIQGSNDNGAHWVTVHTITLTVAAWSTTADDDSDGAASTAPWHMVRANVTAISGTGASVSAHMGAAGQ